MGLSPRLVVDIDVDAIGEWELFAIESRDGAGTKNVGASQVEVEVGVGRSVVFGSDFVGLAKHGDVQRDDLVEEGVTSVIEGDVDGSPDF